ncbi:MAG TPA: peptidylprolyl isomerase [Candidatus Acidoferrum sp.]|jgi:peptidyl-prolyl cis-trans isomerase SurA|nr:peptidylprolyl isomerase [Candidatus Acidoferrum sp.]
MRNLAVTAALFAALPLAAQQPAPPTPAPQTQNPPAKPTLEKPDEAPADVPTPVAAAPKKPAPAKKPAVSESEGKVIEEIVARVNNEVITRSEFEHSKVTAEEDAKSDCQNRCTPEQLKALTEDRQKNALRDLIDQSLLVQRAKDMGISVEPDVIKQLDQIRIENKLPSMEALEQAVSGQGMNWEDFKNNIRTGLLTKKVIQSEVGSHINVTKEEIQKYYDEHKSEFVRPEQVALRSIEINTTGKDEAEVAELKKKAETALKRIQDGEDFGEIAKRYSDGSTAKQGGYLGVYKRGELSKELEDTVFSMKKNSLTGVMETKQGFLIMQVLEHYDEGEQALSKVQNEIEGKLYDQRLEPALREYLKTLREESYVVIKPGYQDAAGGSNSEIQEVSATPEVTKSKKGHKKYLLFGKKPGDSGN